MVTSTLVDLVKIFALNIGTGPFLLGNAVPSFRGVEALVDGLQYNYSVQQGANFEYGTGLFSAADNSITRTPLDSSAGGATINFGPNAVVTFPLLAENIVYGTGLLAANNLADLPDKQAARLNLGGSAYYRIAGFFTFLPGPDETLLLHPVNEAFTFPINFAGSFLALSGNAPAAPLVLSVLKNGTLIGTMTINPDRSVSAATVDALAVAFAVGDVCQVVGPPAAVAFTSNFSWTLVGLK